MTLDDLTRIFKLPHTPTRRLEDEIVAYFHKPLKEVSRNEFAKWLDAKMTAPVIPPPRERVSLPALKTASEIAAKLNGLLSEARILELTEAGYMPCWRIDQNEPRYNLQHVLDYVQAHLSTRQMGAPFPRAAEVLREVERLPKCVPDVLHPLIDQIRPIAAFEYPPAIYFLCKANEVVYVGQSIGIASRLAQHRRVKDFDRAFFLPVPRAELDAVEGAFIRLLKPKLNGAGPRDTGQDEAVLRRFFEGEAA